MNLTSLNMTAMKPGRENRVSSKVSTLSNWPASNQTMWLVNSWSEEFSQVDCVVKHQCSQSSTEPGNRHSLLASTLNTPVGCVRFGSKVDQIHPESEMYTALYPEWDKSKTFFLIRFQYILALGPKGTNPWLSSDQISVSQIVLISDVKKSRIYPIFTQSDLIWRQNWHPCVVVTGETLL